MNRDTIIIKLAGIARDEYWNHTSDEGTGDKMAAAVTDSWQEKVKTEVDKIDVEVPVFEGVSSKIDIVDMTERNAYELKVADNNPQHEFYKDFIKVLVYNDNNLPKIKKLYFITGSNGAACLNRGFHARAIETIRRLGIDVEVIGI